MDRPDVIVVGAGLAGLAAGLRLSERGKRVVVLEAKPYLGGRTASWDADGMEVESGLHRFLGFYSALPRLMRDAGIDMESALVWEDEAEVRVPDGPRKVYGASPARKPWLTLKSMLTARLVRPLGERARLAAFFLHGLFLYFVSPARLDRLTVRELADRHRLSDATIARILVPLTEGIFFLPPERYSAYVLFGLAAQGALRPHKLGIAAFSGGMSGVLADPIADAIRARGCRVRPGMPVERLIVEEGRVAGVVAGGEELRAPETVLATSLAPAQRLVRAAFGETQWNRDMLALPSMPAATLQMELSRPAASVDRTTFAPGTILSTYSEQSRTTFKGKEGRVSVILSEPQRRLEEKPEAILAEAMRDAERVGLKLRDVREYRVVNHPADFYSLSPGSETLRPPQETPVPGLTLAGDYTRQKFLATMEGAVISGERAAQIVLGRLSGEDRKP